MDVALFVLAFFATLGVLLLLYALNFRRRALILGPERLRSALSRTLEGGEPRSREELDEVARELDERFGLAVSVFGTLSVLVLGACMWLAFVAIRPEPALALCGLAVFLLSSALSLQLLREIPRTILREGRREED